MKFTFYTIPFLLFIIFSEPAYSQYDDKFFKQDFIPIYDSLLKPPLNCEEAYSNTEFDSLKNEIILKGILKDQYNLIVSLNEEFETESKKAELEKFNIPGGPDGLEIPGNRPPQDGNGPPGGFQSRPDGVQEIMDDINKANILMDKITVNTEKYKNELKKSVAKLNEELKSTLQNDYMGRVKISNEFLTTQNSEYKKYFKLFKKNISKVRKIVVKYNYAKYLKFPPLKNDLLRLQTAAITNLKFLITITKEFSLTGAKFYSDEMNNSQ